MHLLAALQKHAREHPARPAIIMANRIINYGELFPLVCSIAIRLRAAGVKPGNLVGIGHPAIPCQLLLIYGLAAAGAVAMPMNLRWSPVQARHFLRSLGVGIVVTDAPVPDIGGATVLRAEENWWRDIADGPPCNVTPTGGQPCLLLLSSGTTGVPKATLVSHELVSQRLAKLARDYRFRRDDRFLSLFPMYLGMGRNPSMVVLWQGASVVFRESPKHERMRWEDWLIREVAQSQITYLNMIPSTMRRLLSFHGGRTPLFPSLRMLLVSTSALHPQERKAIRERICPTFVECYSCTEGGTLTIAFAEDQDRYSESVGRAVEGIELEIVDDEGRSVQVGTVGLVRVRGVGVVTEYYRNPEATARAFRDGWFYPGDLGVMNEDGYLFLKGRGDDVINCDGLKIWPTDLEACLLVHPAVAEAAVVGVETSPGREVPVGFVVLQAKSSEKELIAHCRERVAVYELPRRIFFLRQMPKTSSGKVMKARLREALLRKPLSRNTK